MKIAKRFILYVALILVFGGLILYLLHAGKSLDHSFTPVAETGDRKVHDSGIFSNLFQTNLHEALPRLLLQIIIIITATQLLGWLFKKIGQPDKKEPPDWISHESCDDDGPRLPVFKQAKPMDLPDALTVRFIAVALNVSQFVSTKAFLPLRLVVKRKPESQPDKPC